MQTMAESGLMLALFNLGGGEIILILALVLILFGAKKLPDLSRGLGQGLFEFRKATKKFADDIDDEASEAGRSVGGIYGKPAAQALTPDHQVAEIYEPAVFETEAESRRTPNRVTRLFEQLWFWVRRFLLRVETRPRR
jgi:sec-independent protein translocase protein TatA